MIKVEHVTCLFCLAEAKVIEVFGVIAKVFPIVVHNNADELLQYVLNRLGYELRNKKSKLLIAGCLSMISNFFVNYPPPLGSHHLEKVYEYLKVIIRYSVFLIIYVVVFK